MLQSKVSLYLLLHKQIIFCFLLLLFFVLTTLALFAPSCTDDVAIKGPQPKVITLAMPSWYSPQSIEAVNVSLDLWNKENSDHMATVSVLQGNREAVFQKVLLGATRDRFANAALVRNEWIGRLVDQNLIVPLDKAAATIVKENALPVLLDAITHNEKVWAVPFDADTQILWIQNAFFTDNNLKLNDLLQKPQPSEFNLEQGKSLFAFPGAQTPNTALSFLSWYFSRGGELIIKKDRVLIQEAKAVSTLTWLKSCVDTHISPNNVSALAQNDVFNGLLAGQYMATIGGSWERGMLNKIAKRSVAVTAMPLFDPEGSTGVPVIGGWSFVMLKKSDTSVQKLLMLLFSNTVQNKKLHDNNLLPVNRLALDSQWFVDHPDGKPFLNSINNGRSLPFHKNINDLLDRVSLMETKVFLGKKTPDEAVNEFFMEK